MDLPKVVVVNGEHLVTDGNHRIYALKIEGRMQVEVRVVPSGMQVKFHEHALKHALRRGRRGYNGITLVDDEDARTKFTGAEQQEDEGHDFMEALAKNLDT